MQDFWESDSSWIAGGVCGGGAQENSQVYSPHNADSCDPILSSGFIGIVMLKVLGIPMAHMMNFAIAALKSMSTGNTVILALLLGP